MSKSMPIEPMTNCFKGVIIFMGENNNDWSTALLARNEGFNFQRTIKLGIS